MRGWRLGAPWAAAPAAALAAQAAAAAMPSTASKAKETLVRTVMAFLLPKFLTPQQRSADAKAPHSGSTDLVLDVRDAGCVDGPDLRQLESPVLEALE